MKNLFFLISLITFTVLLSEAQTVNITDNDVSCFGAADGTATAVLTGGSGSGYTYLWTPTNETTPTITGLNVGVYTVTITDGGNTYTGSTAITTPDVLDALITTADPSCNGSADGEITAVAFGGTPPYSFLWDDPNAQVTATATGLVAGTYNVTVTDANGCIGAYQSTLSQSSALNVISTTTDPSCNGGSDGSISTAVSGGVPPYTYLWIDNQTTATASNLSAGSYSVTVTDANGCTATNFGVLTENQLLTIVGSTTNPSCNGGSDGEITVTVSGGDPPYSYQWNNGTTSTTATGLPAGSYYANVMDANGCVETSQTFLLNENGVSASISLITNDPCVGPVQLQADDSGGSGNYTYSWSTGETTQNISAAATPVVSVSITDNDDGCISNATAYIPTINGQIETYFSGWLNRGFCRWLFPVVQNNSCQAFTGPITVTLNSNLTLGDVSPTPDNISGNTLTWNNVTLQPGAHFIPNVEACVPLSLACGDNVDIQITADGNTDVYIAPVLCSYDPNDKQVSPVGIGAESNIVGTERLTYTVRFQNTGSIPATFINVIDTLDEDLDILSLRVLATSHSMELIINDRELDFFFENINLPDSTSDLAGSQGFIIYSIDMLPGLAVGTVIENTADIFFDFNEPITTNTTLNTVSNMVGVTNANQQQNGFSVYPNPASHEATVLMKGSEGFTLQIYNAVGQLVRTESSVRSTLTMEISDLKSGIYMLTVRDENQSLQDRLVKY